MFKFLNRIKPVDPKDVERWCIAVHEAAHGVLFAYAGARRIALTMKGRARPTTKNPMMLLTGAYAGYAAEIQINGCTQNEAHRRTRGDHDVIVDILLRWTGRVDAGSCEAAEAEAHALVGRFRTEIKIVASILKSREQLSEREFEEIPCIKQVRKQGKLDRRKLKRQTSIKSTTRRPKEKV